MNLLKSVFRLSWPDRCLYLETVLGLAGVRLMTLVLPFRVVNRLIGIRHCGDVAPVVSRELDRARGVGRAIRAAARHLPWRSSCLVQAITGKAMLARRGIPALVFIGVGKGEAESFRAHAWLKCGDLLVTGGKEYQAFTAISSFNRVVEKRTPPD